MKARLDVLKDSYIPEKLPNREKEARELMQTIETSIDNDLYPSILVQGDSGTGKTALTKHVAGDLPFTSSHVNCWQYRTRHKVLLKIGRDLNEDAFCKEEDSTDTVHHTLEESLDSPKIVVLDDVDKIKDFEVVYDLVNMDKIILILSTCNKADIWGRDERIDSRLSCMEDVTLENYSSKQIYKILSEFAEEALPQERYSPKILTKIANRSNEDLRKAFNVLRKSFVKSKSKGFEEISESIVDDVSNRDKEIRIDLNHHQEILKELIEDEGRIRPCELYEEYEEECEDPRVKRTLRKYLGEMNEAGIINSEGDGRWRVYQVA